MERLHSAIREFIDAIVNPYDVADVLNRLTTHGTDALDAAGVGIMLRSESGDLDFAAASSEAITQVELRQDVTHTGPCYDAFTKDTVVAVDDLRADDRWPDYTAAAIAQGLVGVLGVPMKAHGQTIGVVNIYRSVAKPWLEEDIERCDLLVKMGSAYVLHANQMTATRRLADQLQHALTSRALIEQAKGILMAKHDIDAETAFEWLRKASMDSNRKLRDIARQVTEKPEVV